ncbi:hypothetical protein QTH97_28070 [Variovorax sp. J22R24]|uniref:hypothetical protein n=1 Tax=Variovorax gracilis TaxID=3053502 RepID=UPI0025772CC8|nr:hypothetical protein [Variovorax sp. J22R24]MDM0108829.1 hypothetical protein [Variovorax sp. J22R24]
MNDTQRPAPPTPLGEHEARLGDRGDASGRNIEQNRAIGQDDPAAGSRMGREADKASGFPGTPDSGTDAAQTEAAKRDPAKR